MRVLITTVPFGSSNPEPLNLLHEAGLEFTINPHGRKITKEELTKLIPEFDAVIAGTENIDEDVINAGLNLKHISRVGVGLDSVDLLYAKEKGIRVSYTPAAPAPAVAEMTLGLLLSLIRKTHVSNLELHKGQWNRHFGSRVCDLTVGVIGVGRIGSRVLDLIKPLNPKRIMLNDVAATNSKTTLQGAVWSSKEEIYSQADVITLHVPKTSETYDMIRTKELSQMKPEAVLINTSRGGVINEEDLYNGLTEGLIQAAAVDVFDQEPYSGKLSGLSNCILTAHMGSMSRDCREAMEIEATQEVVRFARNERLISEVPEFEYFG